MTITILIADDHAIVRHGLRTLLEEQPDFQVVGEAVNGREARQLVDQLLPEVVILDIAMPELNGLDAMSQIYEQHPDIQAIILSMHASPEYVYHALKAGARGYLVKESVVTEVVEAVSAVHDGRLYLSQKVSNIMLEDYFAQHDLTQADSPLMRLSTREREIIQMVAEGKSSAEIAQILSVSPRTVKTYRLRIMQKLGLKDLPSLVKFAIKHGLTSL